MLGAGVLCSSVMARQASPAAGEVIDPVECQIAALSDEFFQQLAATPESDASPAPEVAGSPAPFSVPEGDPAGEAEVEAVTLTVRELVACLNAADYRRVYALYTEEYLLRTFGGQGIDVLQATPEPAPASGQHALIGIDDVITLEDGRLAARVELSSAPEAPPVTTYLVFAQVGDRWLIDEETVLEHAAGDDPGTPDSGTPTN
jgi:hypothetical protein